MSVNMNVKDYEAPFQEAFPGMELRKQDPWRYWLTVPGGGAARRRPDPGREVRHPHLSTIVGEDMREHFLVDYILAGEVVVTLLVKVDREKPEVPSLAPLIAGALVYEREIHDLFGIIPIGPSRTCAGRSCRRTGRRACIPCARTSRSPAPRPTAPEEVK